MKEQIKKLMDSAILSESDVPVILDFVAELIDLELQHDKEHYPAATKSHGWHKKAYYIVRDLEEFFNDHYKNNL